MTGKETGQPGPWKMEVSGMSINEALSQVIAEIKAKDITSKKAALQRIRALADYQRSFTPHIHDCLDPLF